MAKELVLIAAVISWMFLIIISLNKLVNLHNAGRITPAVKDRMTYLLLFIPLVGFIWTYNLARVSNK